MDTDVEPSLFLDHDVDTSGLTPAASFPNILRGFWTKLPNSDIDVATSTSLITDEIRVSECSDSNESTTWQLKHTETTDKRVRNPAVARLERRGTWSHMLPTDIMPDGSGLDNRQSDLRQGDQPSASVDDQQLSSWTIGDPNNRTTINRSAVSVNEDKIDRSPRMKLKELVPAHSTNVGQSRILSAISKQEHLLQRHPSGVDLTESRDKPSSPASPNTPPPASPNSATVQHERRRGSNSDVVERMKMFSLPPRINVSKREMNMMSPTSF